MHQLQVENEKLKSEVSNGQGDEIKQLQVEAGELRQSLHDAQEREVSSNELLHKSLTEYHELKSQYDDVVLERAALSMELTDYGAQYEQTCTELSQVKESVDTDKYHALDEEYIKWERRKPRCMCSLKECVFLQVELALASNHCHRALATPARVLSCMVSCTLSWRLPRIPDATSSAVRSTSLSVTAPDFSPAFTARPSIGITPSVYTSPRLAVTFGGSVLVCSSSSYVFTTTTTSTPMRSSPSMDLPVSATTVYSLLATFATRFPTSAISAPLVQPATNQ